MKWLWSSTTCATLEDMHASCIYKNICSASDSMRLSLQSPKWSRLVTIYNTMSQDHINIRVLVHSPYKIFNGKSILWSCFELIATTFHQVYISKSMKSQWRSMRVYNCLGSEKLTRTYNFFLSTREIDVKYVLYCKITWEHQYLYYERARGVVYNSLSRVILSAT